MMMRRRKRRTRRTIIVIIIIIIIIVIITMIAFKGAIRDFFLQSPHCTANCLQHLRSSGQGAIVCKSRATLQAHITCCVPLGTPLYLYPSMFHSLPICSPAPICLCSIYMLPKGRNSTFCSLCLGLNSQTQNKLLLLLLQATSHFEPWGRRCVAVFFNAGCQTTEQKERNNQAEKNRNT